MVRWMVEHAFSKLLSHLTKLDAFFQQENDRVEEDIATVANDSSNEYDETDEAVTPEQSSPIPA